jgi:hypothetical protein
MQLALVVSLFSLSHSPTRAAAAAAAATATPAVVAETTQSTGELQM